MNNKKYLLDISLEIDAADISPSKAPVVVITKEINGQRVIIILPVVEEGTAQGFVDDQIYEHYWNAVPETQGFWLREKTIDIETGLQLVHDKTAQHFLPH
jgi:hypothetical protein